MKKLFLIFCLLLSFPVNAELYCQEDFCVSGEDIRYFGVKETVGCGAYISYKGYDNVVEIPYVCSRSEKKDFLKALKELTKKR